MSRRALLIGSQTGGLSGVHGDVEVMADTLRPLGFSVSTLTDGATYDAILAAYEGLIQDAAGDDAVVVYYSGHGGRTPNLDHAPGDGEPAWLRYLVPTDIDDLTGDRFRGLLAEEVSLLQWRLTLKTPNVVTILDCCHSSRMSRSPDLLPKAAEHAVAWPSVSSRWARLRSDPHAGAMTTTGNPNALRLVACAEHESAYEMRSRALGGTHGALTAALVPILRGDQAVTLTWRQVGDLVRAAVMDRLPHQRPDVEGPAAERLLFSLETREDVGVLPVRIEEGVALLEGAALLGVSVGDRYALVAPGADRDQSSVTAVVDAIVGGRARLSVQGAAVTDLPPGTEAHPVLVSLGTRPVAVVPPDHPRRTDVVAAIRSVPFVEVAEAEGDVLATVRLDGGASLVDAVGEPLRSAALPLNRAGVQLVVEDIRALARANRVRELASGTGDEELPDDVEVSFSRLRPDGTGEVALDAGGEHVFAGDRIVLRFGNRGQEQRFVTVLDVGLTGAVSLITEPPWLSLDAAGTVVVGDTAAGALEGIELFWPEDLPEGAPRPETCICIVADRPVTGVERLSQAGIRDARPQEAASTTLDSLLDDLDTGRRDARKPARPPTPVRYRVHRLDLLLHPGPRGNEVAEPAFAIDERPDPSFRLVGPRAATTSPSEVRIRLVDLSVGGGRDIRLDALAITTPPGGGQPWFATTLRTEGQRLDVAVLYDGPVGRFLDLALWVGRDDGGPGEDLAQLLSRPLGSDEEAKRALAVFTGLAGESPDAALVSAAPGAVSALVEAGARVLRTLTGDCTGLFRATYFPHEKFGTGSGTRRHPSAGVRRVEDVAFALELAAASAVRSPSTA